MENLCTVCENLQKISWFCFNYWDKISSRNYSFTHCATVSVKIKTTYFYYYEMYLCRTFYDVSTINDRKVQKVNFSKICYYNPMNYRTVGENLKKISRFWFNFWDKINDKNSNFPHVFAGYWLVE